MAQVGLNDEKNSWSKILLDYFLRQKTIFHYCYMRSSPFSKESCMQLVLAHFYIYHARQAVEEKFRENIFFSLTTGWEVVPPSSHIDTAKKYLLKIK